MEISNKYKEIFKLKEMLENANIEFTFNQIFDGYQIEIPKLDFDAVEHFGSYGNRADLIEIMGLLTDEELEDDSVKGYLTAENIFLRICVAISNLGE